MVTIPTNDTARAKISLGDFLARARLNKSYNGYIEKLFSKVSIPLSFLLSQTSVTPNELTLISTALAFVGAALVQSSNYYIRVGGVIFWFLAYTLDFCDGDIARYKALQSEFGHWLEAVSDRAKDLALLAAITSFETNQLHATWIVWAGALAIGGTLLHSYIITYGFKANQPFSMSPISRFEGIHYALMAVFVILNLLQVYLLFVAITSLGSVIFNVYSTWNVYSKK